MLFQSPLFLLFFAGVYALVAAFRARSARHAILLCASYCFYGCWDVRFLLLIIASTVWDYLLALLLEREREERRRRLLVTLSICSNLGVLGFFKYFHFFAESAALLAEAVGLTLSEVTLQVTLPVGISFFTFQALTYTIDVYRREIPAERNFVRFALFIAFFPQLVAGPIVRGKLFLPQLGYDRPPQLRHIPSGLLIYSLGLFQKIAIADNLGRVVDPVFATPELYSAAIAWLALVAYGLQIYCDFAGYSNMAIGTARLLGYRLPVNFRRPYSAASISDFWRRWHITLSTWLRDYLYIPLGGSRFGARKTYRNLMLTMVLGGLWHGASWRFVAWGLLHGLALVIDRYWNQRRAPAFDPLLKRAFALLIVFLAWVLFRAHTFQDAWIYYSTLFLPSVPRESLPESLVTLAILLSGVVMFGTTGLGLRVEKKVIRMSATFRTFTAGFVIALAYGLSVGDERVFIYFQF